MAARLTPARVTWTAPSGGTTSEVPLAAEVHRSDRTTADDLVADVLGGLYSRLPADRRETSPIVLVADQISARLAAVFFGQCRDPRRRRPRPTASVRMEPTLLVHPFTRATGWSGPLFCLTGDGSARSAVRWAQASASQGGAALVCEIQPIDDGHLACGAAVRADYAGTESSEPVPSTTELRRVSRLARVLGGAS